MTAPPTWKCAAGCSPTAVAMRLSMSSLIGGSASSGNQAASVFSPSAGYGSPPRWRQRKTRSRYCA
ncbi:hypothetical protein ACU686_08330 [Yinghuangia aomiensis]